MNNPILQPCKVCGGTVSSNAKTCPHCGEPLPENGLGGTKVAMKFFYTAFFISWIYFIARYFGLI